jgi:hypothetical protein
MTVTVQHRVDLFTSTCITCGVIYGIPVELDNQRRRDKKSIYCPNGHPQVYSQSIEDRLRKELEEERSKLAGAQFELMAAEKKVKRLEKRVKNGVCPCCHRQFVQLTRHMKTKHPDYAT